MRPRISIIGSVRPSVPPSVRRSVRPSVHPSVRWSVRNPFFLNARKRVFSTIETVRDCAWQTEVKGSRKRSEANRCVSLVISPLASSLIVTPSSPSLLPTSSLPITFPRHPLPLAVSAVEKTRFRAFKKMGYGRTDGQTDGRTNGWTDRRTNGWTVPLIEMRARI